MKISLVVVLAIYLVFTSLVEGAEYKYTKSCNPAQLAEELKSGGINLLGKDQIGYMETRGQDIRVVIKGTVNEDVLRQIILNHVPVDTELKEQTLRNGIVQKLKALNFTDEEIDRILK